MKTLFSIFLLAVFGGCANFVMVFVLNLAGLPGAFLAITTSKHAKQLFMFGSVISAVGQSYVNLAFVSFIVSWTHLAAGRDDVIGFLVWPVAFLAVQLPTFLNLIRARVEARGQAQASVQVVALHLTFIVTLISFPLFALVPILMKGWAWVPMVSNIIGVKQG